MSNQIVGFISTVAAIIIFLSLHYFYRTRFEKNLLQGKQRYVGVAVVAISIALAVFLML